MDIALFNMYAQLVLEWLQNPEVIIVVGGMTCLLGIGYFLRCKARAIHLYDNPSGAVRVTPSALAGIVYNTCEGIGGIHRPSIKIRISGGKLHLMIRIRLSKHHRLMTLSEEIQAKLMRILQEVLGVERIGAIDIVVVGIEGNFNENESA